MFVALCREGETVRLPLGAAARVLRLDGDGVVVERLVDGAEFAIKPRHLRHLSEDEHLVGDTIINIRTRELAAALVRLRTDDEHY